MGRRHRWASGCVPGSPRPGHKTGLGFSTVTGSLDFFPSSIRLFPEALTFPLQANVLYRHCTFAVTDPFLSHIFSRPMSYGWVGSGGGGGHQTQYWGGAEYHEPHADGTEYQPQYSEYPQQQYGAQQQEYGTQEQGYSADTMYSE